MRLLAAILMGLGLFVGGAMALLVLLGGPPAWGWDWMLWIGSIKIGVAGALGLIATGALLRRVAVRREERERAGLGS